MLTLPNIITSLNLIAGALAIYFVGIEPTYVFAFGAFALIADVLDGLFARLLNQNSPIGKELDSLADIVSFGLMPALLCVEILSNTGGILESYPFYFLGLLPAVCAAFRLARFNVAATENPDFSGMPSPAMAIGILGIYHIFVFNPLLNNSTLHYLTLFSAILFSILMLSKLSFISLKFSYLNINDKIYLYILIASVVLFYIIAETYFIILSIATYILLSCIKSLLKQTGL